MKYMFGVYSADSDPNLVVLCYPCCPFRIWLYQNLLVATNGKNACAVLRPVKFGGKVGGISVV